MKQQSTISILLSLVMVFTSLLTTVTPAIAQGGDEPPFDRDTLYVPGEVVVSLKGDLSVSQFTAKASAVAGDVGAQVVDQKDNLALLSFTEDADVPSLAAQISSVEGVSYAEPNYIAWIPEQNPQGVTSTVSEVGLKTPEGARVSISIDELKAMRTLTWVRHRRGRVRVASIPVYPNDNIDASWGWIEISSLIIWPERRYSPTVCVLDTGIDIRHPDLIGMAINGLDFANDDYVSEDDNGHGTHVAGIISARMNNGKGITGVSNGRVLGVKVLSAQGWGTSFDVSSGITYCANRYDVKVINMSLTLGTPSSSVYNALDYAINTKGKLVAAAAGNDGESAFEYPAAWAADFVCADGTNYFPNACSPGSYPDPNTIHQGLISVGAARSYISSAHDDVTPDRMLWVDQDGGGEITDWNDPDFNLEHRPVYACATDFTNYGAWVQMVAPGEDIYSTVPVSYPFWLQYFWDADADGDGYEWFSGTSVATPYVAGAAARVWSLNPLWANGAVKDQLLGSGTNLQTLMDPNMTDAALGYDDLGYIGEAPFCWPDATKGDFYSMSASRYLNVAAAMNRVGIFLRLSDAITGLPLTAATVYAYDGYYLRDYTRTGSYDTNFVTLLNLPFGATYDIKVYKPGYTAGRVTVCSFAPPSAGWIYTHQDCWLSIPLYRSITAVLNWGWFTAADDLDLYAWLPNVSSPGYIISPGMWGELSDFPRARHNRDGGFGDPLGMESISIVPRPGYLTTPYYNLTSADYYDFLVREWSQGDLNQFFGLTLRIWAYGKIIGITQKSAYCDSDGLDDIYGDPENPGSGYEDNEVWWHAGYMQFGTYYPTDVCGTGQVVGGGGVWPYAEGESETAGIPEQPYDK